MGEYAEYGFDQQGWYGMFVACGIWCLADVSSVSPSEEETGELCISVSQSQWRKPQKQQENNQVFSTPNALDADSRRAYQKGLSTE